MGRSMPSLQSSPPDVTASKLKNTGPMGNNAPASTCPLDDGFPALEISLCVAQAIMQCFSLKQV